MGRILIQIGLFAILVSGCAPQDAKIAVTKACPVMQSRWPDREIDCSKLEARHETWGWIVYRKGAIERLHTGPVARLTHNLQLMDTVYLGS